jgi:hypothetical protein
MRRLLLENIGWKLLSLALAIVLWVVVVGEPRYFMEILPSQIRSLFGLEQSRVVVLDPAGRAL